MRISVALCVFNGEPFLETQLETIASQSRLPDELVVADDGSTDGSIAIIERFANRASFPVRFHQNDRNLRTTKNFEQAIGLCRGDLIVTADQDDAWYPAKLARIGAEFLRSSVVGLVFSDADLIDGDGRPIGARLWRSVGCSGSARREIAHGDAFPILIRRPIITGATMAVRADLRGLILPIPEGWTHDHWIGLMTASVARVVPIAEPLMQYRRHATNQIGVNGVTLAERVGRSLGEGRSRSLSEADRFETLRVALAERLPDRPDLLARIDRKIAHCRARGTLPPARFRRLPGIVRELVTLRYARYSGSSLASARDLMAGGGAPSDFVTSDRSDRL
jgi:glycosyltransferase involved in cell wall biosynthesis